MYKIILYKLCKIYIQLLYNNVYNYAYNYIYNYIYDQTGWPNEFSIRLPCWKIGESEPYRFESGPCGFKPWSGQINDFKIDTCRFLTWRLALLGLSKDWLAQCQDNVTEWDSRSRCWWPGVPVR